MFGGDTASAFPCLKVCNGDHQLVMCVLLIRDLGPWGGTFHRGIPVGVGALYTWDSHGAGAGF